MVNAIVGGEQSRKMDDATKLFVTKCFFIMILSARSILSNGKANKFSWLTGLGFGITRNGR